jgi:ABC-type sugar transport system permease subunit
MVRQARQRADVDFVPLSPPTFLRLARPSTDHGDGKRRAGISDLLSWWAYHTIVRATHEGDAMTGAEIAILSVLIVVVVVIVWLGLFLNREF